MKPFDLEKALAGAPVVTRDGQKVTQLMRFKGDDIPDPVAGVVEDGVTSWFLDGKYLSGCDDALDLFMASEKKEGWANLLRSPAGLFMGIGVYPTQTQAWSGFLNSSAAATTEFVATVKIEWEE